MSEEPKYEEMSICFRFLNYQTIWRNLSYLFVHFIECELQLNTLSVDFNTCKIANNAIQPSLFILLIKKLIFTEFDCKLKNTYQRYYG